MGGRAKKMPGKKRRVKTPVGKEGFPKGGASVLPPLPETALESAMTKFHDMMNDPEARGANKVLFTGNMRKEPAFGTNGYFAPGSYEILKATGPERISGIITAYGGRLYGIEQTESGDYRVTDLRTGLLISADYGSGSLHKAYEDIRVLDDRLSRQESTRKQIRSAEERFKDLHWG